MRTRKRKTLHKCDMVAGLDHDIKCLETGLRKDPSPDTYSYRSGELGAYKWFRAWINVDLGDV